MNCSQEGIGAGAGDINDQWGLKTDTRLAELAARNNVPLIVMSNQRDIGGYDASAGRDTAAYSDVMARGYCLPAEKYHKGRTSGHEEGKSIIDPGHRFREDMAAGY